jgi:hypothetical protein
MLQQAVTCHTHPLPVAGQSSMCNHLKYIVFVPPLICQKVRKFIRCILLHLRSGDIQILKTFFHTPD